MTSRDYDVNGSNAAWPPYKSIIIFTRVSSNQSPLKPETYLNANWCVLFRGAVNILEFVSTTDRIESNLTTLFNFNVTSIGDNTIEKGNGATPVFQRCFLY